MKFNGGTDMEFPIRETLCITKNAFEILLEKATNMPIKVYPDFEGIEYSCRCEESFDEDTFDAVEIMSSFLNRKVSSIHCDDCIDDPGIWITFAQDENTKFIKIE